MSSNLNSRLDAQTQEIIRKHDPDGKIRKKVREERIQEEDRKATIRMIITFAIIITIGVLISLLANY